MNEICFASIDPLALRALPLEGEEIPELSVITLDDCIFLPCQGRCRPCFAEAATRRRRQRQRGFACRVKFSLGEMPRRARHTSFATNLKPPFVPPEEGEKFLHISVITVCR